MLERLKFAPSADLCQHLLSVSYHDRLAVGGAVDYPHRLRAETGYTVHAYLTGKRLALAREQIAAGTPILQAASACGFGDYSAFCRAYRRQFGQPPSSAKQDAAETPKSRKKA